MARRCWDYCEDIVMLHAEFNKAIHVRLCGSDKQVNAQLVSLSKGDDTRKCGINGINKSISWSTTYLGSSLNLDADESKSTISPVSSLGVN